MADIKIVWDPEKQRGDWQLTPEGDIATTDREINNQILLALFTWTRAEPDYVPPDRRVSEPGVWGDAYAEWPLGSRLWQLLYEPNTAPGLLNRAQDMVREALTPLRESGAIRNPTVACNWSDAKQTTLIIDVIVTEPKTNARVRYRYPWAWRDSATSDAISSARPRLDIDFTLDRDGLD